MRWSWKLVTVAGIGIYIHATFLLLLAWILFGELASGHTLANALAGIGFLLALFTCVVLHELGHALMAKRYGIRTRDVTVLPIGGLARLERMPREPEQELAIAVAGPAVNVLIASLLYVVLTLTGGFAAVRMTDFATGPFLQRLLMANIMLVLFNLLPAFPMDGGRVLRALLATKLSYARATQIAAQIGQAMAFVFGALGLAGNPFLLLIAFFVWIGATQEAGLVQIRTALGGIPVESAMLTDFRTLYPSDPLDKAINLVLSGSQQDFPVVDNGDVVGVLTRGDMLKALAERGRESPVEESMQRNIQIVDSAEMLESAFNRLQECPCHTLPVTRAGRLVGMLTSENLGEYLLIRNALDAARKKNVALKA